MKTIEFDFSEKNVNALGRCLVKDGKIICDNVGTGFECRFSGSSIRIYPALESSDASPVYFMVTIDGTCFKTSVASGNQTIVCDGLSEGEHFLKIVRITEIRSGECSLVGGMMFARGEVMGEKPMILPPPPKKGRKIAFFGDSITNGWGVLNDGTRDVFTIYEQDHTKTYAYLTAEHFDADEIVLAISGHGVVSDCNKCRDNPMKNFYRFLSRRREQLYNISDEDKKPNLVVVALGTNDNGGGVSVKEFCDGVRDFVSMIRADLPETDLIWLYGMMGNAYSEAMRELFDELYISDRHLYFLESRPICRENEEIGAGGHPNAVGQKRIASELTEFVEKTLGRK